jgi:hypothetical protein
VLWARMASTLEMHCNHNGENLLSHKDSRVIMVVWINQILFELAVTSYTLY